MSCAISRHLRDGGLFGARGVALRGAGFLGDVGGELFVRRRGALRDPVEMNDAEAAEPAEGAGLVEGRQGAHHHGRVCAPIGERPVHLDAAPRLAPHERRAQPAIGIEPGHAGKFEHAGAQERARRAAERLAAALVETGEAQVRICPPQKPDVRRTGRLRGRGRLDGAGIERRIGARARRLLGGSAPEQARPNADRARDEHRDLARHPLAQEGDRLRGAADIEPQAFKTRGTGRQADGQFGKAPGARLGPLQKALFEA